MTKERCHSCLFLLLLVSIILEHLCESCWGTSRRLHLADHFKGCLRLSSPNDLSASDVQQVPSPWRTQTCFLGTSWCTSFNAPLLCVPQSASSAGWHQREGHQHCPAGVVLVQIEEGLGGGGGPEEAQQLTHAPTQTSGTQKLQWSAHKQQSTPALGPRLGLSLKLLIPDWNCHWSSWSQTDCHCWLSLELLVPDWLLLQLLVSDSLSQTLTFTVGEFKFFLLSRQQIGKLTCCCESKPNGSKFKSCVRQPKPTNLMVCTQRAFWAFPLNSETRKTEGLIFPGHKQSRVGLPRTSSQAQNKPQGPVTECSDKHWARLFLITNNVTIRVMGGT